jgi:hypothetical protein
MVYIASVAVPAAVGGNSVEARDNVVAYVAGGPK